MEKNSLKTETTKLTQEDIDNLNRSISIKNFILWLKTFPLRKLYAQIDKKEIIHKKEIILILYKLFSKIEEGLLPNWFHVANVTTLSPKPGKHIIRRRKKL